MYVPLGVKAVVWMSNDAVPVDPGVKLTRGGLRERPNPVAAGDELAVRLTKPVKPRLFRLMLAVSEVPAKMLGVAS